MTADLEVHAGVMHLAADGTVTWYEIDMPGADTVSSNSAYGDKVVGIYTDADGIHGYVATISGHLQPDHQRRPTSPTLHRHDAVAARRRKGRRHHQQRHHPVTGKPGVGIRGETYGVITNNAVDRRDRRRPARRCRCTASTAPC